MTDTPSQQPTFEPRDPDFRARVEASFARQGAMQTLGVRAVDIAPGRVTLEMDHSAAFTQQHGFLHAGIVTTCLDTACGFAASSLMDKDAGVLTVEFKVNLLAPADGSRFQFRGMVIRPGRTLTFCEGRAFAFKDGQEKLIATIAATMIALHNRPGIKH